MFRKKVLLLNNYFRRLISFDKIYFILIIFINNEFYQLNFEFEFKIKLKTKF